MFSGEIVQQRIISIAERSGQGLVDEKQAHSVHLGRSIQRETLGTVTEVPISSARSVTSSEIDEVLPEAIPEGGFAVDLTNGGIQRLDAQAPVFNWSRMGSLTSSVPRAAGAAPARQIMSNLLSRSLESAVRTIHRLSTAPGSLTYGRDLPPVVDIIMMTNAVGAARQLLVEQEDHHPRLHPLRLYEIVVDLGARMRIADEQDLYSDFTLFNSSMIVALNRNPSTPITGDHIQYCLTRSRRLFESGRLFGLIDQPLIDVIAGIVPHG